MKHFLFILLMVPYLSFAQEFNIASIPMKEGTPFYEQVVPLEGNSKEQLYNAAKLTMIRMYKDAKEVIQNDNKEAGNIIGKGYVTFMREDTQKIMGAKTVYYFQHKIWFLVDITVKDGKYRIQFYDFTVSQQTSFTSMVANANGTYTDPQPYATYYDCATNTQLAKNKTIRKGQQMGIKNCTEVLKNIHESSLSNMQHFIEQMKKNTEHVDQDW